MTMVYCRACGKEIHESAPTCPHCGAPQIGAANKLDGYSSYSEVPFYRKNWFAILCAFVLAPALLLVLLTGGVYYEKRVN